LFANGSAAVGTPGNIVITVSSSTAVCDDTNSYTTAANDRLSWQVVTTGTGTLATRIQGQAGTGGVTGSGTNTQLTYWNSSTGLGSMADFTFASHTITAGSSAILDLHSTPVTTGLKLPTGAGAAPTVAGNIAFDSTANDLSWGNGSTTNHAINITGAAPAAGVSHFAGSTYQPTSSAVVGADMTNGTVTATQLSTPQSTRTACATDIGVAAGDDGVIVVVNPATAIHLTRFSCGSLGGTSVASNLLESGAGGTSLLAAQTCTNGDVNTVNTTTWANGSSQCGGTTSC